ncbi:putative zinc-binding protein [Methanofollis tationis]|uniref:Putative zinc-binding protein n=1 Tax=Methanofollis tationis TaxID=81417 RepID=A0A7K4HN58_9EURY|nr:putative zinc-binding protein [Methanofollis tationis]NVO66713.1 putative zinc-binding protein [Methanofollis tationis]
MKRAPGDSLTEETGCTCGCGGEGKKRIIFPCAGASNVGQLTNIVALELEDEGYGTFACTLNLATGSAEMKEQCREADEIVVLDGCPNRCAATVAAAQGIEPDQGVVVSELGIEISHDFEISDEEIEIVLGAVWEGQGRGKKRTPHDHAGDCTCGCGRK